MEAFAELQREEEQRRALERERRSKLQGNRPLASLSAQVAPPNAGMDAPSAMVGVSNSLSAGKDAAATEPVLGKPQRGSEVFDPNEFVRNIKREVNLVLAESPSSSPGCFFSSRRDRRGALDRFAFFVRIDDVSALICPQPHRYLLLQPSLFSMKHFAPSLTAPQKTSSAFAICPFAFCSSPRPPGPLTVQQVSRRGF